LDDAHVDLFPFLPARRLLARYLVWNDGWVGGWLVVTWRYCVKTAKPILKVFRPSDSRIILFFATPAPIPSSKRNPFSGGVKYMGWENWWFSTEISVYLGNGAR